MYSNESRREYKDTLCKINLHEFFEFRDNKKTSLHIIYIYESLNEIFQNVSKIRLPILPSEKTRESTNCIYHVLKGDHLTIFNVTFC